MSEEAAANGYGTISYINALQLSVSFGLVALFAVFSDEGLNSLEKWAHGAGFQELFQRIYRELMIMGIASFGINIMSASSGGGFGSWEYAYYFSDNIIFLISTFFCIQGIGVMFFSLIEAKSWDRAAKINTEELLRDVENEIRKNSLTWRNKWYPYCTTRNQVEFRVFNLLFTRCYKIGGSKDVFNFGYFLKLSHQRNVISAIDITPIKWVTVFGLVLIISLYYEIDIFHCGSKKSCVEAWSIYSFMLFGYLLVFLAAALCYVARVYELRFLSLAGVTSISDYDIYLQSEYSIIQNVGHDLCSANTVLDVLSQLQVEKDIAEAEKENRRALTKKPIAQLTREASQGMLRIASSRYSSVKPAGTDSHTSQQTEAKNVDLSHAGVGDPALTTGPSVEILELGMGAGGGETESFQDRVREFRASVKFESQESLHGDTIAPLNNIPNTLSSIETTSGLETSVKSTFFSSGDNVSPTKKIKRKSVFDVVMEKHIIESVIVQMQGGKSARAVHSSRVPSSYSSSDSPMARSATQVNAISTRETSVKCPAANDTDFESIKAFYRNELSHGPEYLKNFRNIFYRQKPEWFYGGVHLVMLCNTLYVAWWITTLIFFIERQRRPEHVFILTLFSFLPPVLVFPLLTLLIRRTTLFKALMRLDSMVATNTLVKAQATNNAIDALRQNLKMRLLGICGDDETISKSAVMDLFEDINTSESMFISFDEFQLMLSKLNLHVPKQIVQEIFNFCDSNNSGLLSVEEFERFIFPDESAETDRKNAAFFNQKNTKDIALKKKSGVASQMIAASKKPLQF